MSLFAVAPAAAQPVDPTEAIMRLQSMYPGARASVHDARTRLIYGVPMTPGETPDEAASAFFAAHGEALGVGEFTRSRRWAAGAREGHLTVVSFTQSINETPVDGSLLRVAVLKARGEQPCRVALVAARLAARPAPDPIAVTAAGAATLALAQQGYANLEVTGEPVFVILPAERERDTFRPDAWTWRVPVAFGEGGVGGHDHLPRSFFINACTGQLIKVRDEFAHAHATSGNSHSSCTEIASSDVTGLVRAYATPTNLLPHRSTNTPTLTAIANLRVTGEDNNSSDDDEGYTDGSGNFSLTLPTSNNVDIETRLGPTGTWGGTQWFVVNCQGDFVPPTTPIAIGASTATTSPGTLNFNFGNQNEYETAEANAAVQANRCFEYVISRLAIDINLFPNALKIYVNADIGLGMGQYVPSSSTPSFISPSLRFAKGYNNGSVGWWNMCYSSLFPHEFGHYLADSLGTDYAYEFGEGLAMAFSNLVNNDRVQGRSFLTNTGPVDIHLWNDPTDSSINCQYPSSPTSSPCPCDGGHLAGQLLAGVWLRITDGMVAQHGATNGLEIARSLFMNWILLTAGAPLDGCNSADEETLDEVLTADDDDANLGNGTPNDDIILSAFASHNIP
ncbi:MAG: hypothetical protein ACKVW3_14825 [Phycisphaerales bacterium]